MHALAAAIMGRHTCKCEAVASVSSQLQCIFFLLNCYIVHFTMANKYECRVTRIPSGIWSRLLRAICEGRVSSQHMVKSLTVNPYKPI